jgi:hypothetical protein
MEGIKAAGQYMSQRVFKRARIHHEYNCCVLFFLKIKANQIIDDCFLFLELEVRRDGKDLI